MCDLDLAHALCRRAVSGAAAAAVLLLGAAGPSAALVKGFEPMAALKGKDYGKERQRCWLVPHSCFQHYLQKEVLTPSPKHKAPMHRYSDYVRTPSGLQYQDLRPGTGKDAREGAQVTVDWDGYTIGYYGRPFEARNKVAASSPCWRLQPSLDAAVMGF